MVMGIINQFITTGGTFSGSLSGFGWGNLREPFGVFAIKIASNCLGTIGFYHPKYHPNIGA